MCNNANFGILKLIHPSIRGDVAASGGSGPPGSLPPVELDGHQNCSEPTPDRVRRAAQVVSLKQVQTAVTLETTLLPLLASLMYLMISALTSWGIAMVK